MQAHDAVHLPLAPVGQVLFDRDGDSGGQDALDAKLAKPSCFTTTSGTKGGRNGEIFKLEQEPRAFVLQCLATRLRTFLQVAAMAHAYQSVLKLVADSDFQDSDFEAAR